MYLSPCLPLSLFVSFKPWLRSPCYTGVYFSILLADGFCFVVSLLARRLFCTLTALVASQLEFCSVTCLASVCIVFGSIIAESWQTQFAVLPHPTTQTTVTSLVLNFAAKNLWLSDVYCSKWKEISASTPLIPLLLCEASGRRMPMWPRVMSVVLW